MQNLDDSLCLFLGFCWFSKESDKLSIVFLKCVNDHQGYFPLMNVFTIDTFSHCICQISQIVTDLKRNSQVIHTAYQTLLDEG